MNVSLQHFLALSALLFAIGLYGALARRNAVIVLIGIEIMMNAANLNLIAFARYLPQEQALAGWVFTLFGITIAAAEVAVGLALLIAIYRQVRSIQVDEMRALKG
jgi:NADH:ubiquinone oxidoreductase subunit K